MTDNNNPISLKITALDAALRHFGGLGSAASDMVDVAQTFYDFLVDQPSTVSVEVGEGLDTEHLVKSIETALVGRNLTKAQEQRIFRAVFPD